MRFLREKYFVVAPPPDNPNLTGYAPSSLRESRHCADWLCLSRSSLHNIHIHIYRYVLFNIILIIGQNIIANVLIFKASVCRIVLDRLFTATLSAYL